MRVKRSDGTYNSAIDDKKESERMLRDSWDYWERRGLQHPEKIEDRGIQPLSGESKE